MDPRPYHEGMDLNPQPYHKRTTGRGSEFIGQPWAVDYGNNPVGNHVFFLGFMPPNPPAVDRAWMAQKYENRGV